MRRQALAGELGGATTEMAISMLVFVPTLFFYFYTQDLLRIRLDAQEAVVSTAWDFAYRDFEKGGSFTGQVQNKAREMFCNHSSADDSRSCGDDAAKAQSFAAHASWSNGGREVSCTQDKGVAQFGGLATPASSFGSTYTKGGLYSCTGQVAVVNDLLPRSFLRAFVGETSILDRQVLSLPREQFAILTDTWALNTVQNVESGKKQGLLHDRVAHVYQKNLGYFVYMPAAMAFLGNVSGSGRLVNPGVPFGLFGGDNPLTPNLVVTHSMAPGIKVPQESGNGTYFGTPWLGDYANTYRARQTGYLGLRSQGQAP